jgi:hypothetical protein
MNGLKVLQISVFSWFISFIINELHLKNKKVISAHFLSYLINLFLLMPQRGLYSNFRTATYTNET